MAKIILEPASDRVLVVDDPSETIIDGIEIPGIAKEKQMLTGTVIVVGPEAKAFTHPEDKVLYGPYAGKNVVLSGVELRLLRQGQIEGYLRRVGGDDFAPEEKA